LLKVGDTVEFKATVEPKAADPLFGFWKRPADFKILKLAVDERTIANANPVLAEADYQAKLAKWNALNDEARRRGLSLEEAAKWIAERMKAPDISTIDPQIAATPLLSPEDNAARYAEQPCPECSAETSAGHYMLCSQREL